MRRYVRFVEAEESGDAAAAEVAALFSGGALPRAHLHSAHDLMNFLHRCAPLHYSFFVICSGINQHRQFSALFFLPVPTTALFLIPSFRFSLNSSKHGVDARALALAFGPLILRSTSSSTRELLLLNVASAVTLCQRLVQTPELIGI
jgi:hypothetical protein